MSPDADEVTVTTGDLANGGSVVARHDGRVVFVRYALPGERVRARITEDKGSYLHATAVEILEPSDHRVASLCPVAGPGGAGCCDLAFVEPAEGRALKAGVVANQLDRVGRFQLEQTPVVEPIGTGDPTGWRTRVRLGVGRDRLAGYHRYRSSEVVAADQCVQLPTGMLDGLTGRRWPAGAQVHVVVDDNGDRHVVRDGPWPQARLRGRRAAHRPLEVVEGSRDAAQRVGDRVWQVPVTGFWQSHRDAASVFSALVAEWADLSPGMTAWDLYGGAGVFAAVLADQVGAGGQVLSVDSSRSATAAGRVALADLPQVSVATDSVRRALTGHRERADVAVLDPPRAGAAKAVIDLLADAGVPRIIHFGCEVAAFARDIGLYRDLGYTVEAMRVFDAFPLTHHVEAVALLTRTGAAPDILLT